MLSQEKISDCEIQIYPGPGAKRDQSGPLVFPGLPSSMVVSIISPSNQIGRQVGELVTKSLGGTLIDCGKLYGSLALACNEAGINCEDLDAMAKFCSRSRLDVWVRQQGDTPEEASFFANYNIYNQVELDSVSEQARKFSHYMAVPKDILGFLVQETRENRRLVVLGRDIPPAVRRSTPFDFFLTAAQDMLDESPTTLYSVPKWMNRFPPVGAREVDSRSSSPAKVCEMILLELHAICLGERKT